MPSFTSSRFVISKTLLLSVVTVVYTFKHYPVFYLETRETYSAL